MSILEVRNLTKRFGGLAAVSGVSFSVREGEILGIAGPNGAGKTTLFNLIAGAYRGTGQVTLAGERIDGLRPHQVCHKGLARTFQQPQVFSSLTVRENVGIGAEFTRRHGSGAEARRAAAEAIEFVGLSERQHLRAGVLPLYAKKLTMLAAALATQPKVLLLDEPIAGLSPIEVEDCIRLLELVREQKGVTLVVIEHLMRFLMGVSDRIMVMDEGRIISVGEPKQVAEDPHVIQVYLGESYAASA